MFISNFYGFLLYEFGMLSRRACFSATAELSCLVSVSLSTFKFIMFQHVRSALKADEANMEMFCLYCSATRLSLAIDYCV